MNWFIIALIAPFLWSLLNHADKFIMSKYLHKSGVGGISTFSSIFSIIALPIFFLMDKSVLEIPSGAIVLLIFTGIIFSLATLFSLYALSKEDASYIVPFWQLSPVFAYVLGIIFLGEFISFNKIVGSIICIIGAVILSLEFEEGVAFKKKPVIFMVISSFCIALSDIFFKGTALTGVNFWQAIFWQGVGTVLFGLLCLIFIKKFRRDFLGIFNIRSKVFIGVNIVGEVFLVLANVVNYYAMLLAPVALVLLANYTFQPLFVFIEGVILTLYLPHIINEKLSKKHLIQKFLSILIMALGIYFVLR